MWVKDLSGNAPRDRPTVGGFAADRETAAAATTSASASRPMVMRSGETNRRSASKCSTSVRVARGAGSRPHLASVLQEGRKTRKFTLVLGFIRRISVKRSVGGKRGGGERHVRLPAKLRFHQWIQYPAIDLRAVLHPAHLREILRSPASSKFSSRSDLSSQSIRSLQACLASFTFSSRPSRFGKSPRASGCGT
jgi:hypothetical protein